MILKKGVNYMNNRYHLMQYRKCGHSGLLFPLLSFGLWHNFGGVDSYENGKQIILKAFDNGITHFDLANNYGPPPGSAEENFGKLLKNELAQYRDELIISTKAGYFMWPGPYGEWGSKKHIIASINQSLKRMGLEYVDIFYSHRPDPETPFEETAEALIQIIRQGKALYAAVSSYSPEETVKMVNLLKKENIRCLAHQPHYSMLNKSIEEKLLMTLSELGMGCIVFSPLSQGILTDKYLKGIPQNSRAANPHGFLQENQITETILNKARELNRIAEKRNQTLAQMALAWVLRKKEITSAIISCSKMSQLDDNLKTLNNLSFTDEELKEIDTILL